MTSAPSGRQPLAGRGIVITRPADQGATLAQLVEAQGARAILFPVIEILDPEDTASLATIVDRLDQFDAAIFISPNAVAKGIAAIRGRRELPRHLAIVAIGGGSARALRSLGVDDVLMPRERFDSEALLDLPELHEVAGKHMAIFRGTGGRQILGDTLAARGAHVEYAECYRRVRPRSDTAPLLRAWSRGEIDALVATSSEGVRNLHDMLPEAGRARLAEALVFVPHPRIAATARALGVNKVVVTRPGDESIAQDLVRHFSIAA